MTLLDANTIIFCLKAKEPAASRFRTAKPAEIAIPTIVVYELEYGTLRVGDTRRRKILSAMLDNVQHIPFDREAAHEAARIRLELEKQGMRIGPMDLLIAGTAVSRAAILATSNTGEFSRIKRLRLEDWMSPGAEILTSC